MVSVDDVAYNFQFFIEARTAYTVLVYVFNNCRAFGTLIKFLLLIHSRGRFVT
ncbi:MAG: hypothetical protein LDLANPLL_00421 [Turneriella sp.]|nr:hypothetical protein [Turneriella sp.]